MEKITYDIGKYNHDPKRYQNLINEMYEKYPEITLPPEYASFIQDNLLRFFIRLARYKFVARLIKKNDEVLEVGCGSGLGSIFLSQHCKHVTGLDVKEIEIDEAKSINRQDNVDFINKDLFNLDESKKFDVVASLDVIEHLTSKQANKMLAKMSRLLKPDGMLVIGTPSIYSYDYQSELSKASHVKCYDQKELIELIEKYFARTLPFSMNDEVVHTGHPKMAWFYFIIGFLPRLKKNKK